LCAGFFLRAIYMIQKGRRNTHVLNTTQPQLYTAFFVSPGDAWSELAEQPNLTTFGV
jgi:hypothetical protein